MSEKALRLLLVEDNAGDARLIREMLAEADPAGYELVTCGTIGGAEALLAAGPDAVLLDLALPDGQGLETLECVKACAGDTPIVVLTGLGDDGTALRAVQEGAQDYLVKGEFDARTLIRSVRYAIERNRAERADRERRSLEGALGAMNHLLGILGHELRTPLTSLRLLSEYLLSDPAVAAAEWECHMQSINGEVLRMTDLVNNLLEAARLDSGVSQWNWGTVALPAVCREALELLRPLAAGGAVTLESDIEPAGLSFGGDPDAVRRLIVNLVSNALKHTQSGRIVVMARPAQRDSGRWLRLSVQDTGAGISAEAAHRLGVAFATNRGVVGMGRSSGTGLGLAICKGIAAAHGGSLSVASEPGRGTTFTVMLRTDLARPAPVPADLKIMREAAA